MSLIRRVGLLMLAVVLLALAAGVVTTLLAARDTLQAQLSVKNRDNAQSLALALSQQRGDLPLMEVVLAAQFDTGHYRRIALRGADSRVLFERQAAAQTLSSPRWFDAALPIVADVGVAQVSDGWRPLGSLEVASQSAYANDSLWRAGVRASALLALVGAAGAALAVWGLRLIRRPLDAAIEQAQALQDGRFVTVAEPRVADLQPLARAMNTMVARVRTLFDAQASQVEALRRQAQTDELTDLPNRRQFLLEAQRLLEATGPDGVGLVLLRLLDLQGLNRRLGHARTDELLRSMATVVVAQTSLNEPRLLGRLNGSDLAVCLPGHGAAAEVATSLLTALRRALAQIDGEAAVVAGAIQLGSGARLHDALALADQALARAEQRGAFQAVTEAADAVVPPMGEAQWQRSLREALAHERITLGHYAVRDAQAALLHLDCPLRVQTPEGGAPQPATQWLALAARSGLTGTLDLRVLRLALDAIGRDGVGRCVNLAGETLESSDNVAVIGSMMMASPGPAARLWIDLPEALAVEHPLLVQDLARRWRGLGVRVGLEHAGAALTSIGKLYELGVDYVRIDGRFLAGIAQDAAVRRHAEGLLRLLKGLGLQVFAEAVHDRVDLPVLWQLGFDGATGRAVDGIGA
jgi:diguanylate cyclase (GGDEF)-like protein